jgi:hypothetical protein
MRPSQLQLNRIARGLLTEDSGLRWFEELPAAERATVLRELAYITAQSNPKREEVPLAIAKSGLKPTFTPCVMLRNEERPNRCLSPIAALPEPEQSKSFRLLLALFSIADTRRRETQCKDGCTHEWHNLAAL